jgi:CheY-like chemotaxis protein
VSRRKLLLADDSVTIQKVVNLTFADEGIDVVTVGDGDSAMEKITESLPDLVLADVNMPGLNGYQICDILRENEATKHIPVILLVGSFEPFDEVEATRVGANAYLTKPFQSIRQLVSQVSELMESSAPTVIAEESASVESEPYTEQSFAAVGGDDSYSAPPTVSERFDVESFQPAVPHVEQPEADDINSLYEQSLAERGSQGASGYADIGIDDEMIETSYTTTDENSDFVNFEIERRHDIPAPDDNGVDVYGTSIGETEQPLSEAANEAASFTSAYETEPAEDLPAVEKTWEFNTEELSQIPGLEQDRKVDEPASEDHSPVYEVSEEPVGEQSYAEETPEESIGAETIRMDSRFDTTGSAAFEFDEIDLLELPPVGEGTVEITTPVNAVEKGSNQQVVSLAPELIEMIAQRVVEKLSEKY